MKNPTKLTRSSLFVILAATFVACLLISNILAGRVWTVWGEWTLTGGVFLFPIVLVVNDLIAEVYGMKKVKLVVMVGFTLNLLAVGMYTLINTLPTPVWFEDTAGAYSIALGTTFRALIASMVAYLSGNFLNAHILIKMKTKGKNGFKTRAIISTIFGELVDSMVFVLIMFSFVLPLNQMIFMVILQTIVKTAIEALILPATDKLCNKAYALAD